VNDNISNRLERLERKIRKLSILVACLVGFLAITFLTAQSNRAPDELTVRKIILVNENGEVRGYLSAGDDKSGPTLSLIHPVGGRVATVGINPKGPFIELMNMKTGKVWQAP